MTNFEKWKVELEDLIKAARTYPAIVKGKPRDCNEIPCCDCDLDICGDENTCQFEFFRWLFKEYKERQKLTKRQRAFCEVVSLKYLARDRNGGLYGYEKKPIKYNSVWSSAGNNHLIPPFFSPKFDFIRWEDDEPYPIEEMLTWEVEDGDE